MAILVNQDNATAVELAWQDLHQMVAPATHRVPQGAPARMVNALAERQPFRAIET